MLATDGVSDHYCSTFVSPPLGQSIFFFLKVKGATRMRVSQRLFCSVLRLAASNAWGYLWKHLMAKLLGLRHGSMTKFDRQILGNTESGWCLLMKNRALHWIGFDMNHVNILRMIWSKGFERNRRENARNGWIKIREKGGGKKMTLLFWPSWHVRCFWKPFLRMVGRERMVRREGGAQGSWICAWHVVVQSVPWQFFHRTLDFMFWFHSHFTWTPSAQVSGFFPVFILCVRVVLWCFTFAFCTPCTRTFWIGKFSARLLVCCVKIAL